MSLFLGKKLMLFTLSFLASLLFISGSANAILTCSVGSSPCTGTDNVTLFKMFDINNSHAELSSQSNYNYYVCCWGVAGLGNTTADPYDIVVKLQDVNNSHVGDKSSSYTNNVYLSSSLGASCEIRAADCQVGYECVVKISDITNAHVSSCTEINLYLRICCSADEDIEPPESNITAPPAGSWQNDNFSITVTDNDNVGVDYCEYKVISNITVTQDWIQRNCDDTQLITVGSGLNCRDEGIDVCNVSVRANDTSGNWGAVNWTTFSIDMQPPSCTMTDLPEWSNTWTFNISWYGSDNLAGVMHYNIQTNYSGWNYVPDGYHNENTSLNFTAPTEDTYYFRCNATDYANNTGPWSNIVSTKVDVENASAWFTKPSRIWMNSTSFNVSWDGDDWDNSGILCFDVQWRNETTNWNYMDYPDGEDTNCTPPTNTWIIFNDTSASTTVTDNITYYFRVKARDNAGNPGSWSSPPKNITVDTLPPEVDVSSNIAGNTINITSTATDNISGIANNTIYWEIKGISNSTECGSAEPYGGNSSCSVIQSYTISLRYIVTVVDRAGNSVTKTFLVGRMANFVMNSLHLILGGNYNMRVYVRNIESETDNITLELSGTYPLGLVRFRDLRPWEFDYDLSPDGRNLTVYDMEQYNQTSFFIYILSSDVDEVGGTLILNATSSASGKKESDQLLIIVGYPVIFPGLNEWAVILLIIMAVGIYYARTEK